MPQALSGLSIHCCGQQYINWLGLRDPAGPMPVLGREECPSSCLGQFSQQ